MNVAGFLLSIFCPCKGHGFGPEEIASLCICGKIDGHTIGLNALDRLAVLRYLLCGVCIYGIGYVIDPSASFRITIGKIV